MMRRFVVSATRIGKNPWRYVSLPGFEVLTRAPDEETNWELAALQRGQMFQNLVVPNDWYPRSPVPYTVIIDDTNLDDAPIGQIHSRPIVFKAPVDALAWGELSDRAFVSTDLAEVYDEDTYAINANVYGIHLDDQACASSGFEGLLKCAPPLPDWLIAAMIGPNHGLIREGFALVAPEKDNGRFSSTRSTSGITGAGLGGQDSLTLIQRTQRAVGPGTLWGSSEETELLQDQLKKDKKAKIAFIPLGELFGESQPSDENRQLWESEAALFSRWGLMGPGSEDPTQSHAFLEFVRRARREPVTEQMFSECFGFGYKVMQKKLEKYLKAVLAKPTFVETLMPLKFPDQRMEEATANQIGRILGDWLRMQANAFRMDPGQRGEFLHAAGRILERAYLDDQGLPPVVDPSQKGGHSLDPSPDAAFGTAVTMKPLVITADQIHYPRLLAVYGLYEHDTGNDAKARELLEAATKAKVVRPKAYLVLAELRYAEAIGAPMGLKGSLSAVQAATVLEPLQEALRAAPTLEIYQRILEVWDHCDAKPTDRDIAQIVDGVSLFPRVSGLSYASAMVCVRAGRAVLAAKLTRDGLIFATDQVDRDRLNALLSTVIAPPNPGAK